MAKPPPFDYFGGRTELGEDTVKDIQAFASVEREALRPLLFSVIADILQREANVALKPNEFKEKLKALVQRYGCDETRLPSDAWYWIPIIAYAIQVIPEFRRPKHRPKGSTLPGGVDYQRFLIVRRRMLETHETQTECVRSLIKARHHLFSVSEATLLVSVSSGRSIYDKALAKIEKMRAAFEGDVSY